MADKIKSFEQLNNIARKQSPSDNVNVSSVTAEKTSSRKATTIRFVSKPAERKTNRQLPPKKQSNQKKKKNKNKSNKGSLQSDYNREQAAKRKQNAPISMHGFTTSIRCPVHGQYLSSGIDRVLQDNDMKDVQLYYCKSCDRFYYSNSEHSLSGNYKLKGKDVLGIKAPLIRNSEITEWDSKIKVRDTFAHLAKSAGIDLLITGEPSVKRCMRDSANIEESYEKDILTIHFINGATRSVAGAYCKKCGAVNISVDRVSSLERYCNADYIESVTTKSRQVATESDVRIAQNKYDPKTTVLYVHKGKVRCLTQNHKVISVALRIPSCVSSSFVVINANYCFDCDRFFISADEYEYYRSIYPIMLIRFEYVADDGTLMNLADKSPLMMAGYTVRANSSYTETQRQTILRNVIQLVVLKKHEVINYLNYFISMNGKARNMEAAVEKWRTDLEYVRSHDFRVQNRGTVDSIRKWK